MRGRSHCQFPLWEMLFFLIILLLVRGGADLYPDNNLRLFVGQTLKVTCGLKESTPISNVSDIYFTVNKFKTIQLKLNSTMLNSTHAFTYFKGTKEIKGTGTIQCKQSSHDEPTLTNAYAQFFVQERLQNVTNISSVWHYPNKTFEVSWNLGADYFDMKDNIEVRTTWTPYSNSSKEGINNCSSSNTTHCRLAKDDFTSIGKLYFHIIVQVKEHWKNAYNKHKEYLIDPSLISTHTIYPVNIKKQVKTDKPKDVTIIGISSNCFNISWRNPNYFNDYLNADAQLRILAKNDNSQDSTVEIANSVLKRTNFNRSVEICGLLANTTYHLKVQLKPVDDGYWSDPVDISFATSEDRPSIGPPMTNTSFWVGKCNDEGKRDLIIYWRDLTPLEAKGFLTDYIVQFNSEQGTVEASFNNINAHMSCHVTYNVEVYSSTRVGRTLNPSKLIIPSRDEAYHPPPVDVRVQKLNSSDSTDKVTLNVIWTVDNVTPFQGVTFVFYFCEGQTFSPKICENDYKFERVPFEKQFLELSNVPQEIDQFGFALEKDPKSFTGISWNICVYDGSKKPQQVTGVSIHSGDKADSILVVWNAQSCVKETMSLVLFYHIKYCTTQSGSQNCDEKHIDNGDTSTAELQDLDTDDAYTITVQAEGMNGLMGLPSETVKGFPKKSRVTGSDGAKARKVAITAVILVVLAPAFVLACFLRRTMTLTK